MPRELVTCPSGIKVHEETCEWLRDKTAREAEENFDRLHRVRGEGREGERNYDQTDTQNPVVPLAEM